MLWTIFAVLLVLLLIGRVSSYTLGGLLHMLNAAAVIQAIKSLVRGRSIVWQRVN
ncbi:MAG TPA: DUF5670 family protein [Ignavibacteriales bacterium]|nr:DUF5670 family protein [Ignavibacteriales bacterium]